MTPPGYEGRFRMRCWPDAARETAACEMSSAELPPLRAKALCLLRDGAYGRIELAVWNIELSDWVRMETLSTEG
jgi:hypothetical protein